MHSWQAAPMEKNEQSTIVRIIDKILLTFSKSFSGLSSIWKREVEKELLIESIKGRRKQNPCPKKHKVPSQT